LFVTEFGYFNFLIGTIPTKHISTITTVMLTSHYCKNSFTNLDMSMANELANTFINVRPRWVPDEEANACKRCETVFTVVTRKHHCRNCGNVFCGNCSNQEIKIPKLSYKQEVRVCVECYQLLIRHNF